jgi:cytochrome c-type biogenesis protein CcsB
MHTAPFTAAIVAYVVATAFSLAYLVQRHELIQRLAALATVTGWACQTLGLVLLGAHLGRPPLGSLSEAITVAVWVVVMLEMWIERQYAVRVIGAFVLPVVLVLSVSTVAWPVGLETMNHALTSAWLWTHIGLALIGIAAFVLNFAGALMYLLQERQLKSKRPGRFYYRLPALETLDRLTYRTLALGFPFLTTGLILGALWARTAWGTLLTFDPLAVFSSLAWLIYAATLAGRAAVGWHGRRAAYFAVIGFVALVLTLGAGLVLPGRHGS